MKPSTAALLAGSSVFSATQFKNRLCQPKYVSTVRSAKRRTFIVRDDFSNHCSADEPDCLGELET
jgi:hypothetical protein